jgi:hypothetical protein
MTKVRMAGRAGTDTLCLLINIGLGREEFKPFCAPLNEPYSARRRETQTLLTGHIPDSQVRNLIVNTTREVELSLDFLRSSSYIP